MRDKSRRSKRKRDRKYKHKLKKLHSIGSFMTGAMYVDGDSRRGRTAHKPFYMKCYKSGNHPKTSRLKSCKKMSNKKVRHYNGEISNGCGYKKLYDLWWQMY